MSAEIGLIGLGVMGKSLALNLYSRGYEVGVFNRHVEGKEENIAIDFVKNNNISERAIGFDDLEEFVNQLQKPRRIILMVNAGAPVDDVKNRLLPLLDPKDIIVDGGNSHFKETQRRMQECKVHDVHFFGCGISGGEEGALKGPSIMPGGDAKSYELIGKYLEEIAARDENGKPCCIHIGPDGAGHFVKMVHNGIEYAEMQLLAETYDVCRNVLGYNPQEISTLFSEWLETDSRSYLLEITTEILKVKDGDDWLIDKILDKAGNKGTGSWATIAASELGFPSTMITAALFARYVSAIKDTRVAMSKSYSFNSIESDLSLESLKNAYDVARLINHHQGFEMMNEASKKYDWGLNFSEIARIWTNGCIIRSILMKGISESNIDNISIMEQEQYQKVINDKLDDLRSFVVASLSNCIGVNCHNDALSFAYNLTRETVPANIIQGQRDFFGAHTFRRNDDGGQTAHHHIWS